MIELFREREYTIVGYYQSLLEAEGIPTFVRNENVSVTEPVARAFFPALCILNEEDHERALELVRPYLEGSPPLPNGSEWRCPSCGEMNPANFDLCWSCNAVREGIPSEPSPGPV